MPTYGEFVDDIIVALGMGYDDGPHYWSKGFVRACKTPVGFWVWHSFNQKRISIPPNDDGLIETLKYMERI